MKHSINPGQKWLFDPDLPNYSGVAQRRLLEDWPGIFRTCILELMPIEEAGSDFSEIMGRPTKELYSACGLLLLMEYNNWTVEDAADAYMFDGRVQFALNIGRDCQSMSTRTVERYQAIFRNKELAEKVMNRVTRRLVDLLDVKVDKLRLDSTHVFSDMARFGRTRLMMTVTRRFLIQVQRHNSKSYHELPDELRKRYKKRNWEFGKKDGSIPTREEVAADMNTLITTFENDSLISTRPTFLDLVRTFSEQCEVVGDKIVVRKKTGGNVLQNPSDPDATFDAHKGPGYQVQTAETCSDENETQLIVSTIPETACEPDQYALEKIIDDLEANDIQAADIIADTAYGGDRNFLTCQEQGIKLTAPVLQGKQIKGRIELHEFNLDKNGCISCCPDGAVPMKAWFDHGKGRGAAIFAPEHCRCCPRLELCQVRENGKNYYMYYDARSLRIAHRKRDMQNPQTASFYAKRSGIEATYSTGKRTTGLGQLRVRGRASVYQAISLKITGINIKRAAKNEKIRKLVKEKMARIIFQVKKQLCLLSCALIQYQKGNTTRKNINFLNQMLPSTAC